MIRRLFHAILLLSLAIAGAPVTAQRTIGSQAIDVAGQPLNAVLAAKADMAKVRAALNVISFGAKGDGSDDTAAIQSAINQAATLGVPLYLPRAKTTWAVTCLTVPDNVAFIGDSVPRYTTFQLDQAYGQSTISALPNGGACAGMFALGEGDSFDHLMIVGYGPGVTAKTLDAFQIRAGAPSINRLRLSYVGIYQTLNGFGFSADYMHSMECNWCHASANVTGFHNLIDSVVADSTANANTGDGASQGEGANFTSWVRFRSEFNGTAASNTGDGMKFYKALANDISSAEIDRNVLHGVEVSTSSSIAITASIIKRNGSGGTGNNLRIDGALSVVGSALLFDKGANDNGTGTTTPLQSIYIRGSGGSIDLHAFAGGGVNNDISYEPGYSYNLIDIRGGGFNVPDFVARPGEYIEGSRHRNFIASLSGIAAGSTSTQRFYLPSTTQNTTALYPVTINSADGSVIGTVTLAVTRGANNGSAQTYTVAEVSRSNQAINGSAVNSAVGTLASDRIQVILVTSGTSARDSATLPTITYGQGLLAGLDLAIKNNGSSSMSLRVEVGS